MKVTKYAREFTLSSRLFDGFEMWIRKQWISQDSIIFVYWNSRTGTTGVDFAKPNGECKLAYSGTIKELMEEANR